MKSKMLKLTDREKEILFKSLTHNLEILSHFTGKSIETQEKEIRELRDKITK